MSATLLDCSYVCWVSCCLIYIFLNFRPFKAKHVFFGYDKTSWPEVLINTSETLRSHLIILHLRNCGILGQLCIESIVCSWLVHKSDSFFFFHPRWIQFPANIWTLGSSRSSVQWMFPNKWLKAIENLNQKYLKIDRKRWEWNMEEKRKGGTRRTEEHKLGHQIIKKTNISYLLD